MNPVSPLMKSVFSFYVMIDLTHTDTISCGNYRGLIKFICVFP